MLENPWTALWLKSHLRLVFAFLYVPIVVLMVLSFNAGGLPTAWTGFSTKWYGALTESQPILTSALNSLIVATVSTFIATAIGTLLAIGVERGRRSPAMDAVLFAPMIIPDIVLAIALLSFFTLLDFTLGLHSIIISHVVFNIAFVCAVVRTRLRNFDWSMVEASIDLGANEVTTFFRVVLPAIFPGVLAGALLAFTLSIDEFIIAYFTAGAGEHSTTLPMRIYAMIRFGITPEINAMATILMLVSFHAGVPGPARQQGVGDRMSETAPLIELKGLTKRFGRTLAVDDVSLDLRQNEFFALLGPSGCGKTTLLRMIAGFERPDQGQILLDGADLTAVRPNRRPVNLMFQSYALFPHMTVEKNVAYGLEMERLPKAEIAKRVGDVLAMTELTDLRQRKPDHLSGGQRQRVALARALVKQPRVLLLDEPLGALDKKLREQMQLELKRMQHEVGITFVVVTHDQEEALVMADRIAVMEEGRVAQLGTPQDLYEFPATAFVAGFVGVMNFFQGRAAEDGVEIAGLGLLKGDCSAVEYGKKGVTLAVRPERVALSLERPADADNLLSGRVVEVAYHGQDLNVHVATKAGGSKMIARLPAGTADIARIAPGMEVWCHWAAAHSRILAD